MPRKKEIERHIVLEPNPDRPALQFERPHRTILNQLRFRPRMDV